MRRPLYLQERISVPINSRQGPQGQFVCFWRRENAFPPPEFEKPGTFHLVAGLGIACAILAPVLNN